MSRDQFTFYRSYLDAIRELPAKEQASIMLAIVRYAIDGEEPTGLSTTGKVVFTLVRPTLDSGRRKSEGGKLGGRGNKKQSESNSDKTNEKQSESKSKANEKQIKSEGEKEKEGEVEIEVENECYKEKSKKEKSSSAGLINAYTSDQDLRDALTAFVEMRKTAKKPATDRALKAIFAKLDKFAVGVVDKIGYQITCVDKSTTNCWTDVYQLKPDEFVDKPQPPTVIEPMKPDDRRVIDENTTIDDLF